VQTKEGVVASSSDVGHVAAAGKDTPQPTEDADVPKV
jgi:hypothetical protein